VAANWSGEAALPLLITVASKLASRGITRSNRVRVTLEKVRR
jgi:hypothetical protein